ncbi:MAG: glucosaminidase domain-containing protein [Candidatus Gastranaerophilaceae bacterium]
MTATQNYANYSIPTFFGAYTTYSSLDSAAFATRVNAANYSMPLPICMPSAGYSVSAGTSYVDYCYNFLCSISSQFQYNFTPPVVSSSAKSKSYSNPFSNGPLSTTEYQGLNNYDPANSKIKPGLLKGNLVGKEAVITQLCQKYNVDVALVVTIIGQESGFGTSNLAQHNNFMGYRKEGDLGKSAKGFGYFSTPEKGLEAAIRNLSKYPERYASVKKADMNNIDAIAKIYCEGDAYASAIKKLYNTTVSSYLA